MDRGLTLREGKADMETARAVITCLTITMSRQKVRSDQEQANCTESSRKVGTALLGLKFLLLFPQHQTLSF